MQGTIVVYATAAGRWKGRRPIAQEVAAEEALLVPRLPEVELLQGALRRPRSAHPSISGAMLLPLTKGRAAIIDAADAPSVSAFCWNAIVTKTNVYATRSRRGDPDAEILLHRFLWREWGMPEAPEIDHRNLNGIDCRRDNLRAADHEKNMWNKARSSRNTTGFKGVSPRPNGVKWRARIRQHGTLILLGEFDDPALAHAAYAKAALELRGEFARAA